MLAKVCKVLLDGPTDLSLDELLAKADSEHDTYNKALETSSRGSLVILKCEPNECCVNIYNARDIRLVGGSNVYEGRGVEVCWNETWGTVCLSC